MTQQRINVCTHQDQRLVLWPFFQAPNLSRLLWHRSQGRKGVCWEQGGAPSTQMRFDAIAIQQIEGIDRHRLSLCWLLAMDSQDRWASAKRGMP
jgi:hypothetical protein